MTDDKTNPKEFGRDQLLDQIFQVFGRQQEPGDPPLETLPPSRRLIPHAPLTEREVDAMLWADCEWYGIRPVPKDDPIYQSGYSVSFLPRSRQSTPKQQGQSDGEAHPNSQPKLINRHSTESADREKWIEWLAAMVAAAGSAQIVPERVRAMAKLALRDGVDWKDAYKAAIACRKPWWEPAPPADLVDPER